MPCPQAPEGSLNDAIVSVVLGAGVVLLSWNAEQQYGLNSQGPDLVHLAVQGIVYRELAHTGHRGDLALDPGSVRHKQRLDEIRGSQLVFPNELAYCARSAPAPRTISRRESHQGRLESGLPARNSSQVLHPHLACALPQSESRTQNHVFTFAIRRL